MIGISGIFVSLLLLIYLAYRGLSILIVAPLMALVAVLFNPGTPVLASYTQIFMPALGSFAVLYFPSFSLEPCSESSWTIPEPSSPLCPLLPCYGSRSWALHLEIPLSPFPLQ